VRVEEMLGGSFYRWRGEERGRDRGGGAAHRWTAIDGLVARCAAVSGEGRGRGRVGRRRLSAWRTRGRDGNGWVWVGCSKITPTPTPVKEIHTRTHHAKGWIFTPTPTPSGHPPGAGRPLGLTIQHSMYKYNGSKPNFHHNHSTSVHNQAE
jgi:hypothetical protein